MTDTIIIKKAIEEVEAKTLGLTEQLLEIHEVVYENDKPKIARLDREKEDGIAIAYFPIRGEKFFLAIYLDTLPEVSVRWAGTENYNGVYFRASSDKLNLEQLSQMTSLQSTGGRSKGDPKRPIGGLVLFGKKVQSFLNLIRNPMSLKISLGNYSIF